MKKSETEKLRERMCDTFDNESGLAAKLRALKRLNDTSTKLAKRNRLEKSETGLTDTGEVITLSPMKKIKVEIEGVTPLLMDKFLDKTRPAHSGIELPEEVCERHCYRSTVGNKLYVPSSYIHSSVKATVDVVTRGSATKKQRDRFKKAVKMLRVVPRALILKPQEYQKYTINMSTAIGRDTGCRIVTFFPEFKVGWKLSFTIEYDPVFLTAGWINNMLSASGYVIGIGGLGPRLGGGFGTYKVTHWEEQSTDKKKGDNYGNS